MDEQTDQPRFKTNDEGVEVPTQNSVTPEGLQDVIAGEQYYVFPGTTLTICCLTLKNGFTVTGESACADPDNFNRATGEYYAKKQAMNKIWPLEGYLLRQRLYDHGK